MIIDHIDYIGIDENFPTDLKYFTENLITHTINSKDHLKDVNKIISVALDSRIDSIKIINTPIRISNEGQKLSGKKVLAEIQFSIKIKYITNSKEQYIFFFKQDILKVFYIVVPSEINGVKVEELVRKRKLSLKIYIEDIYADVRDNDIYLRMLVVLAIS